MADEKQERVALTDEDLDKVAGGSKINSKMAYKFYCSDCQKTYFNTVSTMYCTKCGQKLQAKNTRTPLHHKKDNTEDIAAEK